MKRKGCVLCSDSSYTSAYRVSGAWNAHLRQRHMRQQASALLHPTSYHTVKMHMWEHKLGRGSVLTKRLNRVIVWVMQHFPPVPLWHPNGVLNSSLACLGPRSVLAQKS